MFGQGLSLILAEPISIVWCFIGVIIGIIFGSIPGLTATMAIAIFLPVTYTLSAINSISLLIALFVGGISGGLISAILLNMPGTPSSVATTFDGHPMALRGEGGRALGVGILYSFIGTLIGTTALIFIAPLLANIALKFGPYEYFSVMILALTLIISLASENMVKGLISGVIGLIIGTVGMDPIVGVQRFTFGNLGLKSGFGTLTVLVGLYAITEVLITGENIVKVEDKNITNFKMKGLGITFAEFKQQFWNMIRSSAIGTFIGILPGIGGATSNMISYTAAKSNAKDGDTYGKGNIGGLVASEAANNATIGGALIPLLTLGIPGDTTTAMLLGGFMLQGMIPGPLIFETNGAEMYALFIFLIISSFMMLVLQYFGIRGFVKVLSIPSNLLMPAIVSLCAIGAFGLNSRTFDISAMFVFGLLGYAMVKTNIPRQPLVLGFVLGSLLETNLRRGLTMSLNSFIPFITSPISGMFLVLSVLSLAYGIYKYIKKRKPVMAE